MPPTAACDVRLTQRLFPHTTATAVACPTRQVEVNGLRSHPLFAWLKAASGVPGDIAWNFTKFLVVGGHNVTRFSHEVCSEYVPGVGCFLVPLLLNRPFSGSSSAEQTVFWFLFC